MEVINDAIEAEMARHRKALQRLESMRPLEPVAGRLMEMWNPDYMDRHNHEGRFSLIDAEVDWMTTLVIEFHLAEEDSLKDAPVEILEYMLDRDDFEFKFESNLHHFRGWAFSKGGARLILRFYYRRSKSCRRVGTGEYEEKMKVVCD